MNTNSCNWLELTFHDLNKQGNLKSRHPSLQDLVFEWEYHDVNCDNFNQHIRQASKVLIPTYNPLIGWSRERLSVFDSGNHGKVVG